MIVAKAQIPTEPPANLPTNPSAVFAVLNNFINWLFYFLLIGAVFVVIIAAFTFLTAAGEPEKTKKARNYIVYAIVAVVVAFLSKSVVFLVMQALGAPVSF